MCLTQNSPNTEAAGSTLPPISQIFNFVPQPLQLSPFPSPSRSALAAPAPKAADDGATAAQQDPADKTSPLPLCARRGRTITPLNMATINGPLFEQNIQNLLKDIDSMQRHQKTWTIHHIRNAERFYRSAKRGLARGDLDSPLQLPEVREFAVRIAEGHFLLTQDDLEAGHGGALHPIECTPGAPDVSPGWVFGYKDGAKRFLADVPGDDLWEKEKAGLMEARDAQAAAEGAAARQGGAAKIGADGDAGALPEPMKEGDVAQSEAQVTPQPAQKKRKRKRVEELVGSPVAKRTRSHFAQARKAH